jgi:ribosome biogenesis GTPase
VRLDAKVCHVEVDGIVNPCSLRGQLFEGLEDQRAPVSVGDLVEVDLTSVPGVVDRVLPRKSKLSRAWMREGATLEQVLVANVDQVVLVAACAQPRLSLHFVDRVLCAAELNHLDAVLVCTKVDLAPRGFLEELRKIYDVPKYEIIAVSKDREEGLSRVRECLRGKLSVVSGLSGVGKSTLLNRVDPKLNLKTGHVSHKWETGRHTTTHSQLLRLHELDGYVIDTPGLRNFVILRGDQTPLSHLFPEFVPFLNQCAFTDCSHSHEPQCAVLAAVEAGSIPPSRFGSYQAMVEEGI